MVGAAFGVGGGLLWALYADRLFGLDALLLLVIGCMCGLLVQVFLRNNWLTALLLDVYKRQAECHRTHGVDEIGVQGRMNVLAVKERAELCHDDNPFCTFVE